MWNRNDRDNNSPTAIDQKEMTNHNSGEKVNIEFPHSFPAEEILKKFNSDPENGLSENEVQKRLETYGPNQLEETEEKSLFRILIDQVTNPVVYLLTAAAVLAFIFGDMPEGIAILVVLLLNTIIGFWMETQAHQSMKALKEMEKIIACVIRDKKIKEIDADQLVPGDIIELKAGDLVPADGRIIQTSELSVDESPLTGESVSVDKDPEALDKEEQVADRKNMVFKGTAVTNGSGKAVIVTTGMETELGSVSQMVSEAGEEQLPLNMKLQNLTKNLIWATLGLATAFFLVGWLTGKDTYQLVQTSIAWTIAAIPEGLPIVASIALAKGMLRLADHQVIVKQLAAVETLGETTVIFTDKTGTLTLNKLTLDTLCLENGLFKIKWEDDGKVSITDSDENNGSVDPDNPVLQRLFEIAVLCNDASLEGENNSEETDDQQESGKESGTGDPLDLALLQFASAYDTDRYKALREKERLDEEPFDSEDMVMGTIYEIEDKIVLLCKGAPEAILERCTRKMTEEGNSDFPEEERDRWMKHNNKLSDDGMRVIALATTEMEHKPSKDKDVEQDLMHELSFVGLTGFIDPPRPEAADAVDICRKAGIHVEMITGDHPGTAKNIARQVNITDKDKEAVIHGKDLEENKQKEEEVINTQVFARVDPGQKLDLINYYQDNGDIVAMTGDGVNDAPALKKADIGIAMGKKGTQVAREASSMILKNDTFSSIVEAIREGRVIFSNIRKFIMYQLSYHLSEILVIAFISFTVFNLPLLPLQLLFLNLLSDVFPALALGIGEGNPNTMQQKPKDPEEPIINKNNWFIIGMHGLILAIFISGSYFFAYSWWELSADVSNNVAFFSLALAQLWHVFDMRESDEPIFSNQVTHNKYVWAAVTFCLAVIIAAYFIPTLSRVLSFQQLDVKVWVLICVTSLLPLLTIQSLKEITKESRFSF